MPFDLTLADLLISTLITWGLGLSPAIVYRYVWVKAPLEPRAANWIAGTSCLVFFFLFRLVNASAGVRPEDTTGGLVWVVVFFVSKHIMIRGGNQSTVFGAPTEASPDLAKVAGGSAIPPSASDAAKPRADRVQAILTDSAGPPLELYDRRFDWLLCSSLAFFPIWALYDLPLALLSLLGFVLVGSLKPLRARLNSAVIAGLFAAGSCLLISPILQIVADANTDGPHTEWLRNAVLPSFGLALIANTWLRRPNMPHEKRSIPRRFLRWGLFPLAAILAFAGPTALEIPIEDDHCPSQGSYGCDALGRAMAEVEQSARENAASQQTDITANRRASPHPQEEETSSKMSGQSD